MTTRQAVYLAPAEAKEEPPPRPNHLALLTVFLSVAAAAVAIRTTPTITFGPENWGLVTQLSPFYWVGLLCTGLLVYLGRESKPFLACAFGLVLFYLFVIPTLVAGHSLDFVSESFYKFREGVLAAKEGHIVPNPDDPLIRYHYWPGFLYVSAALYHATGVESIAIPDYMAFFTIFVDGLLVFCILRTRLSAVHSLVGTTLFVAGFWTTQQQFHPQGTAYILYLTMFLLLVKMTYGKDGNGPLPKSLFIVVFGVIVITHPLTPVLILSAIAAFLVVSLLLGRGSTRPVTISTIALLGVLFAGYWIYLAYAGFETSVRTIQSIANGDLITSVAFLSRGSVGRSLQFTLTSLSSYLAAGLLGLPAVGGAFSVLRDKRARVAESLWLVWPVALIVPGSVLFLQEGLFRSYIFALVPLAYLAMRFLRSRPKLGAALVTTLLLVHVPAHYGQILYMRTITDIENAGTAFYVAKAPFNSLKFYGANWVPALWYHDPLQSRAPWLTLITPPVAQELMVAGTSPGLAHTTRLEVLYEEANYIGYSSLQTAYFQYHLEFDPLAQLHFDNWSNRVYDNGSFWLYKNLLAQRRPS